MKKKIKFSRILLWTALILVAVVQIFPLIWLLDFSLASSNEMFTSGLLIIPKKIQWGNYQKAFVDGHFLLYLKNSVLIDGLPVVEIGDSCFEDNTEIVKVTLPDTIDSIGASAFAGCENLTEIVFSENLMVIGFEAFAESGLKNVTLPDKVEDLGEAVFFGCPKLESVFLPESVKLIPLNTFVNTPALKSVTIAAEKALIDKDAFTAADGLTLIGIPDSSTQNYAEQMGIAFAPYELETTQK